MLALWDLVTVPFFMCFDVNDDLLYTRTVLVPDITTTLIYFIGAALGMKTSFIDEVHVSECVDMHRIRSHLFARWQTWADVVSILALPVMYIPSLSTCGRIMRVAKCWRLSHQPKRHMLLHFAEHAEIFRLTQIFGSILVLSHLYACAWFSARVNSATGSGIPSHICFPDHGDRPLQVISLDDFTWCYVHSLHDSVSMLVGWGNPDAFDDMEVSFQIAIGLISDCMMAYIYGMFVAAISFASILEDRFAERTAILHAACDNMHLPTSLRFRVCRYHSYLAMHHMGMESRELFDQLSVNLTSELRVFRMRDALTTAHFFKGLSPRLCVLLVSTCTDSVYSPGDMVIRKGEMGDCMYIILRGHVSILIDNAATQVVSSLHKNQCFGELGLLHGRSMRTAWVRTETFTVLTRLDKDRFEACLDERMKRVILTRISSHVRRQKESDQKRRESEKKFEPQNCDQNDDSSSESSYSSFSTQSSDSDSWMPISERQQERRQTVKFDSADDGAQETSAFRAAVARAQTALMPRERSMSVDANTFSAGGARNSIVQPLLELEDSEEQQVGPRYSSEDEPRRLHTDAPRSVGFGVAKTSSNPKPEIFRADSDNKLESPKLQRLRLNARRISLDFSPMKAPTRGAASLAKIVDGDEQDEQDEQDEDGQDANGDGDMDFGASWSVASMGLDGKRRGSLPDLSEVSRLSHGGFNPMTPMLRDLLAKIEEQQGEMKDLKKELRELKAFEESSMAELREMKSDEAARTAQLDRIEYLLRQMAPSVATDDLPALPVRHAVIEAL